MTNNDLNNFIKQASMVEATPALVDYWQKQYSLAFANKANFESNNKIGEIDLLEHLTTDKKDIDHQLLQQTIAILVRFLDAITDDLDFRSIHLSVKNFEQFLKTTDTPAQIGVDYVGGLVADFSYRASENLAHEKGSYKEFEHAKKHIRPVEYEMWVDDHENYKNGQELSTMFDDSTLANSPWKLVPRRNFAILDFPNEPIYWDKWRDSYNLTIPNTGTKINVTASESLDDVSSSINMEDETKFETDFDLLNKANLPDTANISAAQDVAIEQSLDLDSDDRVAELPADDEDEQMTKVEELTNQNYLDEPKNPEIDEVKQTENVPSDDISEEKEELVEELQHEEGLQIDAPDDFILGELVKIIDQNSPWKDQVYQIVDIQDGKLKLAGDEGLESIYWDKTQLSKQNLYELLNNLNNHFEDESPKNIVTPGVDFPISRAAALVINQQNKILLAQVSNQQNDMEWTLPSVDIDFNQIPEEAIIKHFKQIYTGNPRILDEIGSVMLSRQTNDQVNTLNSIYNVFLIDLNPDIDLLNNSNSVNFQYFDIDQISSSQLLVKVAIDKHKRHQKLINDIIATRVNDWEVNEKNQLESEIKAEYELKLKEMITASVSKNNQFEQSSQAMVPAQPSNEMLIDPSQNFDFHDDTETEDEIMTPAPIMDHFGPDMQQIENVSSDNLSKFKVKLDTMIESKDFGNINLILGYGARGINSITIAESSLNTELKSTLDLILHLFNHLLTHGLDLKHLLSGLNLQYGLNEVPVTQVLGLVLHAIQNAPSRIKDLGDEMLM